MFAPPKKKQKLSATRPAEMARRGPAPRQLPLKKGSGCLETCMLHMSYTCNSPGKKPPPVDGHLCNKIHRHNHEFLRMTQLSKRNNAENLDAVVPCAKGAHPNCQTKQHQSCRACFTSAVPLDSPAYTLASFAKPNVENDASHAVLNLAA